MHVMCYHVSRMSKGATTVSFSAHAFNAHALRDLMAGWIGLTGVQPASQATEMATMRTIMQHAIYDTRDGARKR